MEITYQLRPEDMLALTDDFVTRSPTARRAMRRPAFLLCMYMVLASLLFWWLTQAISPALGILVFGVVLAAFIPARLKRSQRRMATAIYREGRNRALFLPTTLTIDRDTLAWRSDSGSGHVKVEYIERVGRTETHLLIYLTLRNAYVVPRDGVTSGDFDSFAHEVERRWRSAVDRVAEPHELHSM
jgi:YcxB-like protein